MCSAHINLLPNSSQIHRCLLTYLTVCYLLLKETCLICAAQILIAVGLIWNLANLPGVTLNFNFWRKSAWHFLGSYQMLIPPHLGVRLHTLMHTHIHMCKYTRMHMHTQHVGILPDLSSRRSYACYYNHCEFLCSTAWMNCIWRQRTFGRSRTHNADWSDLEMCFFLTMLLWGATLGKLVIAS